MEGFLTYDTQGFTQGLNWAKNAESIAPTELSEAENCEYDYAAGYLRTVEGVSIVLDAGKSVDSLFYDKYHNVFYYSSGVNLYVTSDFKTSSLLGSLTGTNKPVYAMYNDICIVASGAKLQAVSGGSTLQTISGSKDKNDYITTRVGRALAYSTSDDYLYYSAIGDYTAWTNDSSDTSSAQFIKIGYKDAGHIVAVDFLSKVIMVYKENGRAYKVVGEPQDSYYAVEAVSQTAFCGSTRAAVDVGDKAYYLGDAGFMSFVPTNDYGDIEPFDEGVNINQWLINNLDSDCQVWHIIPKKQIWIKTQNDKRVYIYHYVPCYSDERGPFTIRTFSNQINDVCCVDKKVYIAYGNKIGILDGSIDTDDSQQIVTVIKSGNRLAQEHFILVMSRLLVTSNIISGNGFITCGKKTQDITLNADSPSIYGNDTVIYNDTDNIYADSYTSTYKVGGGANKSVQIKLQIEKGAIGLRELHYQYLEV